MCFVYVLKQSEISNLYGATKSETPHLCGETVKWNLSFKW